MATLKPEMNSKAIILAALLVLSSASGFCQTHSAGIFNSPKGFGLIYETTRSGRSFDRIAAYADLSGILFNREPHPGVIAGYSHLYRLPEKDGSRFYFGPGVTLGYVTDVNAGYGFALAVNCTAGWRFTFPGKPVTIDLDFTANMGLHVRSENNETKLAFYKRGLYETLVPQLTISYVF